MKVIKRGVINQILHKTRCNIYLRTMNDYLEGYTIVELSSVLAGPFAGMMFSELGAKVIKVENKSTNGDVTRSWKSISEQTEKNVSAYYSSVNYNKEVVFLDFKKMNDINKTYELLRNADVVITNFKKGDDYKFALDYGRVKTINPQIIYAKLTGYESTPEKTAYDVVLQAECGFMSMNGQPSSPPTKMPIAMIDVLAGHQLRSGILTALLKKEKTKKGSLVEVSLERTAISALVNQGSNFLMNDHIPQRLGSRHPNIALYGEIIHTFENKEIVLALGSQKHFELLCNFLNLTDLIQDQRFSSNSLRLTNIDVLASLINAGSVKFTFDKLTQLMRENNIPFGEVKNLQQVSEGSLAKDMVLQEKIEDMDTKRFSTIGFRLS